MKKMLSLLLLCLGVFGIVTILSGTASALIMTVGDPYEGNSWHQRFGVSHFDRFDTIEMSIESEGSFKNERYYSDVSWDATYFSSNRQSIGGNSVSDLIFEVVMKENIPEYFSLFIQSRLGYSFQIN